MSSMSPEADGVIVLKTREASPSHFLLKVESFSLLGQHGIHRCESREFNAGGYKWRLILYPNEDKTGNDKDYISIHLAISDTKSLDSEVTAFFSIFVLNQILGNYHYSPGRTRRFMAVKSEWGIPKFMSKKDLNNPSNGYLVNNNCVFGVEVFIVGTGQYKKSRWSSFSKRLLDFTGVILDLMRVKDFCTHCQLKNQTHDEHKCRNKTGLKLLLEPEVEILETREASPTHFLMKIESFSLLFKYGIYKYQTREFDAGGIKWRLIICPNEDKSGIESKYISVYLAISDTNSLQPMNWEVNVVFSIFLFNQISGKYHHSLGRTRRFLAIKSEWGISEFISKKALMDPSNGFLINDNCVFGAEVFILNKSTVYECLSVKNVTVPYKRDWKISHFSKLGDTWTSEIFVVEGLNWEVCLYPKGKCHEKGRWVEAYLHLIDSKRVNVHLTLCIKDQINNNHKKIATVKGSTTLFSPTYCKQWGGKLIELATLEDPKNEFIIHDCCLLEIEFSVQAVVKDYL